MKRTLAVVMMSIIVALTLASCEFGLPGFPSFDFDDDIAVDVPDMRPPHGDDEGGDVSDSGFTALAGRILSKSAGAYVILLGDAYDSIIIEEGPMSGIFTITPAEGDVEKIMIKVMEKNKAVSIGTDTAFSFTVNDDCTLSVVEEDSGLENIYVEAQ